MPGPSPFARVRAALRAAAVPATLAGCATHGARAVHDGAAATPVAPHDTLMRASPVAWHGTRTAAHLPWLRGVGPALVRHAAPRHDVPALADVRLVTWNMQSGGGDLDAFVAALRAGGVDGRPATDFVVFVQEAYRAGDPVPATIAHDARGSRRVAPRVAGRASRTIDALATRLGLHVLYVPSMRNGLAHDPAEDRGNAILSTLPLASPEAFELPLERERRVGVAATVRVRDAAGDTLALRLVNVHLDVRARWARVHRSLWIGRADQAQALVAPYAHEPALVLGGDLNTWFAGAREPAVRVLRTALAGAHHVAPLGTVPAPGPIPDRHLDHLFVRVPGMGTVHHVVGRSRHGSDHHPVVVRVEPPTVARR